MLRYNLHTEERREKRNGTFPSAEMIIFDFTFRLQNMQHQVGHLGPSGTSVQRYGRDPKGEKLEPPWFFRGAFCFVNILL